MNTRARKSFRGLVWSTAIVALMLKYAPEVCAQQKLIPPHAAQAAAFDAMRLRDENGNIPPNGLFNALQQAQQMSYDSNAWPGAAQPQSGGVRPEVADLNTNNWQWLGPGNVGGRIRSIIVHPTTPSTIWVGGVGGGVWKTTNSGASFFPCSLWTANLAVCSMAMDPTDANTLYAGTGEGFGNFDAIQGAGIFKSSDGGTTWLQLSSTTNSSFFYVNRLSVCPTNHLILLAATWTGVWRSTNGGTNWTQTYSSNAVKQVAFHPTDGFHAIATPDGIPMYSTNGGVTWGVASGLATSGRIEFAYAPGNPNIVYASQDTNEGTLFLSTNGGVNYAMVNTGSNYLGVQGWYGNCIWVDPTNPTNLIVGGIDLWWSGNGGATLTQISDWGINQANNGQVSVHADHHAIVNAPGFNGLTNTTMYFGDDGGFYSTTNIYTVTTTTGWTNMNHSLGVTQFYGMAGNATTLTVVGGSQDNGSERFTQATGTNGWSFWGVGDGGFCAADQTDPDYFFGEDTYLQVYRSSDGGLTSSDVSSGIPEAGVPPGYSDDDTNAPVSANFIAPFVLDPNNPNTILGGASNLWRTVNARAATPTWASIKNGVASGQYISAVAIAAGNSDLVWVGYNDGEVYSTTNGTSANPTWIQEYLNTPALPNRNCTRLTIDPTNHNVVYATFGGFSTNNIYRTADGGNTWTSIAGGLPAAPVYSLVVAPFNTSYIYAGTEVGVFGSANSGASWSPANQGPANARVEELTWVRNYLVAATHGVGAFWIALGPPTVTVALSPMEVYTGSNATCTATGVGTPPLAYQWQFNSNNIAGATNATLILTNVQLSSNGTYTVTVTNSEGSASASAALAAIPPPLFYAQTVSDGPVAYWRFNEPSGSTAYDYIGGYNGTNYGSLVLGMPGPTPPSFAGFESGNTAYEFDGETTDVEVPALNLGTNVTITSWIYCNGTEGYYPGIFSWSTSSNQAEFLFGQTNNMLGFNWGSANFQISPLQVPTNQWTFVALVVTASNVAVYMQSNSTLVAWTNNGASTPTPFNTPSQIGNDPYGRFNGLIDEVAVFNQALSPTQLGNLLAAGIDAPPTISISPLTLNTVAGGNAAFTANAGGYQPISYQWEYDGNVIAGATNSTLTFSNVQPASDGLYSVTVSNLTGTAASSNAQLTVTSPTPYYAKSLATGPVAFWQLNETTGTTAFDYVGGFNGTDSGNVVTGVSGPGAPAFPGFGNGNTAYEFDGSSAEVNVPALNLNTNTVTITAWVNCSGDEGYYPGIFSWYDGGSGMADFLIYNGSTTPGSYWGGSFLISSLNLPINQWAFAALVISPSSTEIYVATNATLSGWTNSGANTAQAFNSGATIGNNPFGFFSGGLADVAIFNQALSFSQVSNLVAAALSAAPAVTLTAPTNGGSYMASNNVLLAATVTTNGQSIGSVKFYSGVSLLGQSSTPPYQYNWSGAAAGTYTVYAEAVYNGTNIVVSLPANIIVTNGAAATGSITGIHYTAGTGVTLNFTGTPGHAFNVQRGTNLLAAFSTIFTTNAPAGGVFSYTDNLSSFGTPPKAVYYRLNWTP